MVSWDDWQGEPGQEEGQLTWYKPCSLMYLSKHKDSVCLGCRNACEAAMRLFSDRGGTLLSPTHRMGYREKLCPVRMRRRDVRYKSLGTSIVHEVVFRPCMLLMGKYWSL